MSQEPCQCADCQRFYKEHDRFVREFPTFKQQQELNWASIQAFRTLCNKVTDDLQKQLRESELNKNTTVTNQDINNSELNEAINDLEDVNAYLYSIEALMEKIFNINMSKNIESKFQEFSKELAPDPLNLDRLILNRLFHQTPDYPDQKNIN